jgi:hypothetical protein
MGLESATYIDELVETNPTGSDNRNTADDHLRLIKSVLKSSFPNVSGAVSASDVELSYVDGVTSAIQTQLDSKQTAVDAFKASNTSRTSTTTLANDGDLVLALTSGTWEYELLVSWRNVTSVTPDLKTAVVYSGTRTLHIGAVLTYSGSSVGLLMNTSAGSLESGFATLASNPDEDYTLIIKGTITVTDAGNLQFQWAQVSSSADATRVNAGSRFTARKIA